MMRRIYERFTGEAPNFADLIYESKKLILRVAMSSESHVLARRLDRISEQRRFSRDFTLNSLRDALAEIVRLDASASDAYAEWVAGSVSDPDPGT